MNVPKDWSGEVRATRLGARIYEESVDFRKDPRGREYLWLGGPGVRHEKNAGSDTDAYDERAASITPLHPRSHRHRRFRARLLPGEERRPEAMRKPTPAKKKTPHAKRGLRSTPLPAFDGLSPLVPRAMVGVPTLRPPPPAIARPVSSFDYARSLIRDVPDFPKPGIVFKDITPLLASPRAFHIVLDGIAERFIGEHIDAMVGIEARGFIFGGALAARLNASFVPARKPGKLPGGDRSRRVPHRVQPAELEMHKG